MLLTIGMIVRNEEKYLRKCLEALQPILRSISSELIIVDTGSTDHTVEIAKEFTDKVYFFEWINDFAAARNYSLEKAQGEWFMAVDGDEIFISCDDIIDFFKSGEYKQFNSACYTQRNYADPDRTGRYIDRYVPRMTRLLPETKYINAVHERFNTYGQPVRLLTDIADHYGYVKAMAGEKAKRNAAILLKRLETEEPTPMMYRELFEALHPFQETEAQACEFLQKGIELCLELKTDYVFALYHCHMAACVSKQDFEKAIEIYDEYFGNDKGIRTEIHFTDLDVIAFAAISFYMLKRFDEAYRTMQRCFDVYNIINRNRSNMLSDDMLYSYRYLADEKGYAEMHIYYFVCCLETNHITEAEESLKKYPASAFSDRLYFDRIKQGRLLAERYDAEDFVRKFKQSDEKFQGELFTAFRSLVFGMPAEKRNTIIKRLESANIESAAQKMLIAIYKGHFLGNGAGDALLMEYAEKFGMDHPDLFIMMDQECMNALSYFSKSSDVAAFVGTGLRAVYGFRETMARLNYENVSRGDIYNSVRACLCVITGLLKEDVSVLPLYKQVGNLGIRYIKSFGEGNIPAEIKAAVTIAEINLLRSVHNFRGCLDALRRLVYLDKKYAPIVMNYQELIKTDITDTE